MTSKVNSFGENKKNAVYLIATAWLLWNAHRTITIERRMSWFKWRILLASAGADLICTVVSVTRGAMILLEISHGMGIISVLEVSSEILSKTYMS